MENKDNNQIKSSSIKSEDINDLKEILEIKKLSRLLDKFYIATGLATAILDLKGNILYGVGWKSICTEFHRKHKISSKRCLISDTILSNLLKKNEKYAINICQNGMVDAATPIIIDGVHVANIFIGQFFFETPDKDFFIKQAEELGFDKEKYMNALEKCQVYNKETIEGYLDFFCEIINAISELAQKTLELKKQNEEKEKWAAELIIADKELAFQSGEKADRAAELLVANKELRFQNEEKDKRAAELIIANKELAYQNEEKDKRAAELIVANKELAFQNEEKDKRAAELIVANKELAFQNEEKEKRATELAVANVELAYQKEEKEKRANESLIANEQTKALQMVERYTRSLIEASIDPLVTIGPSGKITDLNGATEKITGLPREKLIGTDFSEYFSDPIKARAGYQHVFKEGKILDYELNLKHINGNTTPVLYNATIYNDEDGKVVGVFAAARDVTTIRKAEKYNRSLIEASLDSLVTIGPNGKITDVNTATEKATGLPREKLIGTVFSEYFTDSGKAQAGYQQVFKDGKVFDYELNLKHISGYSIPVLYNASVYKDDAGEIIGVFAAARDITTIRKAENELIYLKNNLESANKELEAFSYSVSHDLKAPLRHITGYISLLEKKYTDLFPEEGRHYLDNISYSAKNMGELIDGLLQFSRTGRIDMNQRLLNMTEIIDDLIRPIKDEDVKQRIIFNINPMPLVFGDFNMIKSVWSNLIENAVKFTKNQDSAIITIGAEENENDIVYYIKDNGAGFDMNFASKLFAVFQRLHSREDYDGTGIGLATVQRIIIRHGGKTWAEGKVGEGATFYFSLIKRKESE